MPTRNAGSRWRLWRDRLLPPVTFLAAIVTLWELAVYEFNVQPWLLPAPHAIVRRFLETGTLWMHTRLTLFEAFAGFGISAVLGVLVAAGISHSRFLERGLFPYIIVANAVPIIAVAPLLTIWLGYELAPKVVISFIITFFPIVTSTTRGLQSADYRIIEFMRSINATTFQVFRKIEFPTALPYIFAGFKISISLSLVGAVVAEFYGADHGLGYLIVFSATQLHTDLLFVAITVLAVTGVAMFLIFSDIEKRLARGTPPR